MLQLENEYIIYLMKYKLLCRIYELRMRQRYQNIFFHNLVINYKTTYIEIPVESHKNSQRHFWTKKTKAKF